MPNWKKVVTSGSNAQFNHVTASNNISASGTVTANAFVGDGSGLTSLPTQTANDFTTTHLNIVESVETNADVTDTANVTAAGALMDSELTDLAAVKAIDQSLVTTANVTFNHVTASGNISSSGDLTINDIYVVEGKKVYFDGTDSAPNTYILKSGLALQCYVLGAQKISVSNTNTVFSNNDVQIGTVAGGNHQDLTVNGNISASNNFVANHITASGNISASGVLTAEGLVISDDATITDNLTVNGDILIGQTNKIANASQTSTHIQFNTGQMLFDGAGIEMMRMGSTTGTIFNIGGVAALDFTIEGDTDAGLFFVDAGADKVAIGTVTVGNSLLTVDGDAEFTHVTASSNISASGTVTGITGSFHALQGDTSKPTGLVVNGYVSASGDISAVGNVWSDNYYQFETTAKADTDDDDNWQGPNSYGIHTRADWNYDYGTLYDDNSATNAGTRTLINTGWRIPHGANYSASIVNMQVYIQPNSNITHADADNFSCSMWYSKASDLVNETNVVDGSSGTFIQRHAATAISTQFKASDESLSKYNLYHVSASIGLDLAPGAMLFPRIKTVGTNDFTTVFHWVVNYKKIPL